MSLDARFQDCATARQRPGRFGCRRRFWLASALTALGGAWCAFAARGAHGAQREIAQPETATPAAFIARAFAMRRVAEAAGDQPFGAIVVWRERIVGEAPSRVVAAGDPTAHAEMEAIRDAARRLGARRLTGATLYASSRPCPMCEAAAYWAGIDRLLHGEPISDAGPPRLSRC